MLTRKFFPFLAAVLLIFVTSCSGRSHIQKVLDIFNEDCPQSLGEVGVMTGAELVGDNVIITCEMNEDLFNVVALKGHEALLKQNMKSVFQNPTDDVVALLEDLKKNDCSITYIFVGSTSGDSVSVTMTSDELENLDDSEELSPDKLLENHLAITAAQLPLQVDEMTVCNKIVREGDAVVYYYVVDETQLEVSDLEELRSIVEENLLNGIRAQRDDPASKVFIRTCRDANVNFIYRYNGSVSGDVVEFEIPIADVFAD